VALNYRDWQYRPDSLRGDPTEVGELGENRTPSKYTRQDFPKLTIDQLMDEVSRVRGLHGPPDETDVAEYLIDQGATPEHMAQFFDPESMAKLSAAGVISPLPVEFTTAIDPALGGELEEIPEFAQRFAEASGHGIRRRIENAQKGYVDGREPAFPVEALRQMQQDIDDSSTSAGQTFPKVKIADWEPPIATAVVSKMGQTVLDWGESGNETLENLAETATTDESNTAPAFLTQSLERRDYINKFAAQEFNKSRTAFASGDTGQAFAHLFGGFVGAMGRFHDSVAAEVQIAFGQAMARAMLNDWGSFDLPDLPLLGGFADPQSFEFPEADRAKLERIANMKYGDGLVGTSDEQAAQWARDLFNNNGASWPAMTKGLSENSLTLAIELALPGPKILAGPVKAVARRMPFFGHAEAAVRKLKGKSWDKLSARKKEKLVFTSDQRARNMEGKIDAVLGNIFRVARDSADAVDLMETLARPGHVASESVKTLMNRLNNVHLALPNGPFMQTLRRIKGSSKQYQKDGVTLTRKARAARADLAKNGANASKITLRMYDSDDPPPLPFNMGDQLDVFRTQPLPGQGQWSPGKVIEVVKNQLALEVASAEGWAGPVLWIPFLKQGNMNPVRWISMQSKAQLGFAWLFMRGGFAPLNVFGGVGPMAQQQGWRLFRSKIAYKWLKTIEDGGKKAGYEFDQGMRRLFEKNAEDGVDVDGEWGNTLDTMVGHRGRKTADSRVREYLGGRDVGPTGVRGPWPSFFSRLPVVGKDLTGDWRWGVGRRFDEEEFLAPDIPYAGTGGVLSRTAQKINKLGGSFLNPEVRGKKVWQRIPGIGGMTGRAVSATERNQHFINQALVIEQVAKRQMADAVKYHGGLAGMPESVQRILVSLFDEASGVMWNEALMREWISELGERTGKGFRASDDPQDFLPTVMDSTARSLLRNKLLDAGPDTTGDTIQTLGKLAAAEHLTETQKLVDEVFDAFPASPGKTANDLLRIFRETGAEANETTYNLISAHRLHDAELSFMQTTLMDVLSRRLTKITAAASDEVTDLMNSISKRFEDARLRQAKDNWELIGLYRAAIVSSKKDTRLLKEAGEEYRAGMNALHKRTAQEFQSIADEITGDEMIDAYNTIWKRAATISSERGALADTNPEKMLQQVRTALREVAEGFRREDGTRQPGFTQINRVYAGLRDAATKKRNLYERSDELARINRQRVEEIRSLYDGVAARHGLDPLPDLTLTSYLSESDWVRVLRDVDAEKIAKGSPEPLLESALIDDSIGSWITVKAERTARQINEAADSTAREWDAPPAVKFNERVIDADEIINWRNSAMSMGRQIGEQESNKTLFPYIYNRAEVALQSILPYPYWTMKFSMFQLRQVINKPAQFRIIADIYYDWMEETQDLPPHLQQTVRVKITEDGREYRFDPAGMLGGAAYTATFTLLQEGTDPELNNDTLLAFKAANLLNIGTVYPWISGIGRAIVDLHGEENVRELLSPEVFDPLFRSGGYIPPTDQVMSRIAGSTQLRLQEQFGQRIAPEAIYTHGLTQHQRHVIGYILAEAVADGELEQEEAMQAIIDLQAGTENPNALAAMIKYFQRKSGVGIFNWAFGQAQVFEPQHRKSIELQEQYNQLREQGRDDEAEALIKLHPELPVRWMIWKDLTVQMERLNKVKLFLYKDDLDVAKEEEKNNTALLDQESRRAINEKYNRMWHEKKTALGLSDETLGFDDKPISYHQLTGEPLYDNARGKSVKTLVSAYFDLIKPEDYRSETGNDTDLSGYYEAQESWLRENVPDGMLAEFEIELSKNISAMDALYRTLYELSFEKYWEATMGEPRDVKEQWITDNPPPSPQELARETAKNYSHRTWAGEGTDPATNVDYLIKRINNGDMSIQGYLDRRYTDKVSRLRRTGQSFKSPSGRTVNDENVGAFNQALTDFMAYNEDSKKRKAFNMRIDEETQKYNNELRMLSPTDFAVGKDDGIRMKYLGSDGKHGSIGIFKRLKKLMEKNGELAIWTEAADDWFRREDGLTKEDVLREMSSIYREIVPTGFLSSNGVDWDKYYEAREAAFRDAIEFGAIFEVSEDELNEALLKDRIPAETVWKFWQETYIQPALDKRHALKDPQGRITLVNHNLVEAEFNRTPKVSELISDLRKKYPHLKRADFVDIMDDFLPSFGEYWQLRGYSKPKT
jgi:hypothetical protein